MPDGGPFTIVQLSDLHCGQQFFLPNMLERAIAETNELAPDVVVISGDLTSHGFKEEYVLAQRYLAQVECEAVVVIPGNHDSRNVGYVHFEERFGSRNSVLRMNDVTIVSVDSTEPDLDNGQIGRGRYGWIEDQFAEPARLRIFVLHHAVDDRLGLRGARDLHALALHRLQAVGDHEGARYRCRNRSGRRVDPGIG